MPGHASAQNQTCTGDHRGWIGLVGWLIGMFMHFGALVFTPASILSPTNALNLIFSAWIGNCMYGEVCSWTDQVATGCIVGCIMVATLAAAEPSSRHTYQVGYDLLHANWRYGLYEFVVFGVSAYLFTTCIRKLESACCGPTASNDDQAPTPTPQMLRQLMFVYGLFSGLVGSQTPLEIKNVIALCMCWYLFEGLWRGSSIVIMPSFYVAYCLTGTVGAFLKFDEFTMFGEKQLFVESDMFFSIVTGTGNSLEVFATALPGSGRRGRVRDYREDQGGRAIWVEVGEATVARTRDTQRSTSLCA
ncbi:unnamed protein product [Vitrella brassicaformis CCMP3155]|uniref:Uncharacterized protein n=1 Tax=Vitrella brassicaformis (strain CCMP3155) TaxID=1169540 RepID=A0A0G4GQB3_VITBC|nr:unnamed protein product [Vitrella brassicaformis CCMP3155]|eukprot:CEM32647.1 unnamed protein product [Vitrella brassicaformis CCMP3155]